MNENKEKNLDIKPYFIDAIIKYSFDNGFTPAIVYDNGNVNKNTLDIPSSKNNFITIELNIDQCLDLKIEKDHIKFYYKKIGKEVIILTASIVSVFVVENNTGMSFVHSSFMEAIKESSKIQEKRSHLKVVK